MTSPESPTSRRMTLEQAVSLFAAQEQVETVLVMLDKDRTGQALRKVFVAWALAPPQRGRKVWFSDGADLWVSLWDSVRIDYHGLRRITGLNLTQVRRHVATLSGYRLIYPDGRTSENGARALRVMARDAIGL